MAFMRDKGMGISRIAEKMVNGVEGFVKKIFSAKRIVVPIPIGPMPGILTTLGFKKTGEVTHKMLGPRTIFPTPSGKCYVCYVKTLE
jgi:hypothetical protein